MLLTPFTTVDALLDGPIQFRKEPHDKMMLHAVVEALHVSTSNSNSTEPQWEDMTERDAERLVVAGGLHLIEPIAAAVTTPAIAIATRVQRKFCFQYIRPWEKEPRVQVLRLREEVMMQQSAQTSTDRASVPAKMALAPPVQDSKRRRSLLMAMQSPFKATRRPSAATIAAAPTVIAQPLTQSAFASPRCKAEVLTPSRSSASVLLAQRSTTAQQQQPPAQELQQQQQILRTPEPVVMGKRKRVSVTISPPQAPRALHAAPVPQLSSSRWNSPKPELLVLQQQQQQQAEEQDQQPPRKTRRLSEAGEKVSMTSFLASKLCAFFTSTSDTHNGGSGSNNNSASSESGTESDKSEAPSAGGDFGDCDLFGGNATLLADMQDVLEPVWSLFEATSSRLQRVVWEKVRDLSSPFMRIAPFEQQQSNAKAAQVSELIFDGFEFGDEDDNGGGAWENTSNSSADSGNRLVVRTRRQCREMRQLSATWRLW